MNKQLLRTTAALALLSIVSQPVSAHSGTDREADGQLRAMVAQAQLIFLGRVTDVTYRNERVNEKGAIPVTYVTYEIEKTLRGKPGEDKLTVRFLGGSDGQGGFLSISAVPRFQERERDLLLIADNGTRTCPLVKCELGRFRILDNGVYNAHGVPVRALVKEGVIARGRARKEFNEFRYPAPRFDDLLRNARAHRILEEMQMSVAEARERYEREAPREIVVRNVVVSHADDKEKEAQANNDGKAIISTEEPLQEGPISIEEFMDHLSKLSSEVGGSPRLVKSIDPRREHPIRFAGPVQPAFKVDPVDGDDERAMARENGDNPVIRK